MGSKQKRRVQAIRVQYAKKLEPRIHMFTTACFALFMLALVYYSFQPAFQAAARNVRSWYDLPDSECMSWDATTMRRRSITRSQTQSQIQGGNELDNDNDDDDDGAILSFSSNVARKSASKQFLLAMLPHTYSLYVRFMIQKVTGELTASCFCDPRIQKVKQHAVHRASALSISNCGHAVTRRKARVIRTFLPFSPQCDQMDHKALDFMASSMDVLMILPNPIDYVVKTYLQKRKVKLSARGVNMSTDSIRSAGIPKQHVQQVELVYKAFVDFWKKHINSMNRSKSSEHDRIQLHMVSLELLAQNPHLAFKKISRILLGKPVRDKRIECALDSQVEVDPALFDEGTPSTAAGAALSTSWSLPFSRSSRSRSSRFSESSSRRHGHRDSHRIREGSFIYDISTPFKSYIPWTGLDYFSRAGLQQLASWTPQEICRRYHKYQLLDTSQSNIFECK